MDAAEKSKLEKQKRIETLKELRGRFWRDRAAAKLKISKEAAAAQLNRYNKEGIIQYTGEKFEQQKIYVWVEKAVEAKQVRRRELKLKVDESNCRKLEFLARIRLFSVEDYVDDLIRREVQQHDWDKLNE